ncbi:TPA: phage tail protein [Enterobacter cloacae]
MNAFSMLSNGLGFNSLKDFGKGLAGHFLQDVMERSIGTLGGTRAYTTPSEDMQRQKAMVKAAMRLRFAQGWQWTVEVEGFQDFQMFAKDIAYSPITIETETKQIGGCVINKPTSSTISTVSLTVRDTGDGKLKEWFTARAHRVVNKDGTINVPAKYLMRIAIYNIHDDGSMSIADEYKVYPTSLGEITRGRDNISEFLSYPIVFTVYSNFDGTVSSNLASTVGGMVMGPVSNIGRAAIGNLIKF